MGSDQIGEIAPGVREALSAGPGWCATFEVAGDADKWVQLEGNTINAAYPFAEAPGQRLADLPGFIPTDFEPEKFLTGRLDLSDARSIARWIDSYFAQVLGCAEGYALDVTLTRSDVRYGARAAGSIGPETGHSALAETSARERTRRPAGGGGLQTFRDQ